MAATGGSHLSGGRVNVGLLRECARRELLQCLNKQPGSKVTPKINQIILPEMFLARYETYLVHASLSNPGESSGRVFSISNLYKLCR